MNYSETQRGGETKIEIQRKGIDLRERRLKREGVVHSKISNTVK